MSTLTIHDGNSARYDRQIRLWGDHGQHNLGKSDVAVIGSGAMSTETMKCLVLAGIRSFTVFDNEFVKEVDLGNNFFLEEGDLGRPRAEVVSRYLKELNPAVRGDYQQIHFDENTKFDVLEKFSIVIGCQLSAKVAVPLGEHLHKRNIPFIWALSLGLLGFLRICVGDHEVHNNHAENAPYDFRIWNPFPALKEYADSIDLEAIDHEQHSHVPFLLLYVKALPLWRQQQQNPDALPAGGSLKKSFINFLNEMRKPNEKGILDEVNFQEAVDNIYRSFANSRLPHNIEKLFNDPRSNCHNLNMKNATAFWVYITAIKVFYNEHGYLPLSGPLPDMTSDTQNYVRLVNIFKDQAETEADWVLKKATQILIDANLQFKVAELSFKDCREICKNVSSLDVITGGGITEEEKGGMKPVIKRIWEEIQHGDRSDIVHPLAWLVLLKARDRFTWSKNRAPGTNGVPIQLDSLDLADRVKNIFEETEDPELIEKQNEIIPQKMIKEICRYGTSELNVVSSILGGIVAQEAIKLCTQQYVPVDNTLVYDAHRQISVSIRL
ncbi:unnamed protein product [Bursaphelenchus xylophilus]|uniref:NEDD8-activating enzyme E1 regulatory subunit n=1 Tax=Bursaphelenchus xylophilus TaxID=6326 RepID=A0A1I7S392_BURXY|nr:unnamed protein product [Bursaphelenchus xylophilus]CAG9116147.1 unnamed protein product [Bursaphelenchus xylophilus]